MGCCDNGGCVPTFFFWQKGQTCPTEQTVLSVYPSEEMSHTSASKSLGSLGVSGFYKSELMWSLSKKQAD